MRKPAKRGLRSSEKLFRSIFDNAQFYASRNSVFRFNAGTILIHYLQGYVDPNQPPTSVISTKYYSFQGSSYFTTGYVFRF